MAQKDQKFEDSHDVPAGEIEVVDLEIEEYWSIDLHKDRLQTELYS